MDENCFDALTKTLSSGAGRRQVLTGLLGGTLASLRAGLTTEARPKTARHKRREHERDRDDDRVSDEGKKLVHKRGCPPCKKRKQGKCKKKRPDGTACPGGTCQAGRCICTPACTGKTCGDDGCGGSCGTCSGNQTCQAGTCRDNGVCANPGTCGDRPECGPSESSCSCGTTVDGEAFCTSGGSCSSLQACTATSECPEGFACSKGCCSHPVCVPTCELPPPVVTEQARKEPPDAF